MNPISIGHWSRGNEMLIIIYPDIYSFGSNVIKSRTYNAMVHRAPNTLTLIDKREHGRKRRIISQGLSQGALRLYEPAILRQIHSFCHHVGGAVRVRSPSPETRTSTNHWSKPQNLAPWCECSKPLSSRRRHTDGPISPCPWW